jgi:uncharacterized protein with NRDE domain
MCTVTYVSPAPGQFILTSNRDEAPARGATRLVVEEKNGKQLIFPQDPTAGGTWIAAASNQRLACLLNGAFEVHDRQTPYRLSRGIMVLDSFSYPSASAFLKQYPFEGIEPFTLILYDHGALWELRWDGQEQFVRALDPQGTHIWSSATLYPADVRFRREQWFAQWLEKRPPLTIHSLLQFHQNAGDGDTWNDVVMNRAEVVRTVSITSIEKTESWFNFRYMNLLTAAEEKAQIELWREESESY